MGHISSKKIELTQRRKAGKNYPQISQILTADRRRPTANGDPIPAQRSAVSGQIFNLRNLRIIYPDNLAK
jgi:hypothetical protein